MEIAINKEMTVKQLTRVFNEVYPFLKLEVYCRGDEVSSDSFHTLLMISSMKNPQNFIITSSMTVSEVENEFWESMGLQVAIFRKMGSSWLRTAFTNSWTLERQNHIGESMYVTLV
ncbi:MAG: hypothetical protein MUF45_03025 [Spirosomaceae bacterium]|jgi:hypothetical protein|nr:hypothetical protein [Spirosomataceae bacterium]